MKESKLRKIIREELVRELDYSNVDLSKTGSKEPAQHRIRVDSDAVGRAKKMLDARGIDYHDIYKASGGFAVFTFLSRGARSDAYRTLRDKNVGAKVSDGQGLSEAALKEIGFENLPPGWDEDSLESFARSLTGKTKDDTEGFWTTCYERMQDEEGFDKEGAKAFCAALKDEYLGDTDWRGGDD